MRQTIYLDILFLLNMLVTFLLLCAAEKMAAIKTKRWRLLLAVLLGGIFSLFIFIKMNPFETFFVKVSTGFLLCAVAFLQKKTGLDFYCKILPVCKSISKLCFCFFFITPIIGCCIFWANGIDEAIRSVFKSSKSANTRQNLQMPMEIPEFWAIHQAEVIPHILPQLRNLRQQNIQHFCQI